MSDATQPTLEELRARASELDIPGRSKMGREDLTAAIAEAEAAGGDDGGTQPGAQDAPVTDAQTSTAGIAAAGQTLTPGTPEEVGRDDLVELAQARAANRNPRVIGATTQED
jgi:hypothetical protein